MLYHVLNLLTLVINFPQEASWFLFPVIPVALPNPEFLLSGFLMLADLELPWVHVVTALPPLPSTTDSFIFYDGFILQLLSGRTHPGHIPLSLLRVLSGTEKW